MPVVKSKKPKKQTPKEPEARVDEQIMEPGKYEVTDDTTFKVELHLQVKDGRWVIVSKGVKGADSHSLVFRMWTYDEMVELKKKATTYEQVRRVHVIDHDALNRLKVQKLLLSWTLDRENPRLKLHRVNGVLTDESWQMFVKLQPNIINYIFSEMNNVYELNG